MEVKMRKFLILAVAGVLLLTVSAFLIKPETIGAAQEPRQNLSAFELMSKAHNLPVAPTPDAF
jgi:hypothetical protein